MDDAEALNNEHSSPAALLPTKDNAGLAEPPPPLDAAASLASSYSESDCSHDIIQAVAGSPLPVHKDDGRDRHLTVNGTNEVREKLAESKNSYVVEYTFLESSMVSATECEGTVWENKTMAGEFTADGAVSVLEEPEPREAYRLAEAAATLHRIGLRGVESSDTSWSNQSFAIWAHGATGPFESGVNVAPSGSQQLQAASDDSVRSPATGNALNTALRVRNLAPTDGGTLTSPVIPAASSGRSHELAGDEMAFESDNVRLQHIEECLRTDQEKTEEVKQNLDTVCQGNTRCGQRAVKLRRQRGQARERALRLEKQMELQLDLFSEHCEFLLQMAVNLQEKNRRLSAVNTEQRRHIQDELSRRGYACLSDVVWPQLELQVEVEQLRQQLRLKEEEVRSLETTFHRFRKASEKKYLNAIDDIMKQDTMLQRSIQTLEAEDDVVSHCPRLMQLLRSLRGGGGTEEEAPSSSDTNPSLPSGAKLVNGQAPTAI